MICSGKRGLSAWSMDPGWLTRVGMLCVLSTVAHGAAELGAGSEAVLPMPSVGLSLVRLLGALALVLAMALGGVWVMRHWTRFAPRGAVDRTLKVLEVRMLGGRQSLVVVGYQDQRLLLASSPTGVSFLCRLPTAEPGEARAQEPDLSPTFMDALSSAVGRRG